MISRQVAGVLAVAVLAGCEGRANDYDVDHLPEGDGTGSAATGVFDYSEVVTSSGCPEELEGVRLPRVGDTWAAVVETEQLEGYFRMLLRDVGPTPGTYLDGGIDEDGSFEIGASYYYHYPITSVLFGNMMNGKFVGGMDRIEGYSRIDVIVYHDARDEQNKTQCRIRIAFEAVRR